MHIITRAIRIVKGRYYNFEISCVTAIFLQEEILGQISRLEIYHGECLSDFPVKFRRTSTAPLEREFPARVLWRCQPILGLLFQNF